MRPPNTPPGYNHYSVRVLDRTNQKIKVICPVCYRDFEIKQYGIVRCPFCESKLEYKAET